MKRYTHHTPYKRGLLLWAFFCVIALAVLFYQTSIPPVIIVIAALSIGTFLLYGLDKLFAVNRAERIPERVLFFTAFAGGAPGALLGMYLFKHKTAKRSFQLVLALVILLELLIISYATGTLRF